MLFQKIKKLKGALTSTLCLVLIKAYRGQLGKRKNEGNNNGVKLVIFIK
jgi:hypothetical protein